MYIALLHYSVFIAFPTTLLQYRTKHDRTFGTTKKFTISHPLSCSLI